MNNVENARALFDQGFSCSQAVFAAFAPDLELDKDTALKIASSFGGGMAGMGLTCGAVTGAFMVLGLKFGRVRAEDTTAKERNYERVGEFVKRFKALHSSILCREILGADMSTMEGKLKIKEKNLVAERCPGFVKTSAEIVAGLLDL